jgi:hypothetical protein
MRPVVPEQKAAKPEGGGQRREAANKRMTGLSLAIPNFLVAITHELKKTKKLRQWKI